MPVPRKARPLGRYSRRKVIQEMKEQFGRRGRGSRKALAHAVGLTPPDVAKRQKDEQAHWNFEEVGRVADEWGAPTGWPFIGWDEALERDKAWRQAKRRRRR